MTNGKENIWAGINFYSANWFQKKLWCTGNKN